MEKTSDGFLINMYLLFIFNRFDNTNVYRLARKRHYLVIMV